MDKTNAYLRERERENNPHCDKIISGSTRASKTGAQAGESNGVQCQRPDNRHSTSEHRRYVCVYSTSMDATSNSDSQTYLIPSEPEYGKHRELKEKKCLRSTVCNEMFVQKCVNGALLKCF